MPLFFAFFKYGLDPYWDVLRRRLGEANVSKLTIAHASNLFGHPIGILVLIVLGQFSLPRDPQYFLLWGTLIAIAACANALTILGLLKTKFFGTQVVGSLGFVSNAVFAVLLLGEHLAPRQIIALCLATLGTLIFILPKGEGKPFIFDRGIFYTLGAVILGGISSVCYKLASRHVPDYATFVTGRFVVDLIVWTAIWAVVVSLCKRSPFAELRKMWSLRSGIVMTLGGAAISLLSSWLIFRLPISTLAVLSTLAFPVAYFFSRIKYRERITPRMWAGTFLVLGSVLLFLL